MLVSHPGRHTCEKSVTAWEKLRNDCKRTIIYYDGSCAIFLLECLLATVLLHRERLLELDLLDRVELRWREISRRTRLAKHRIVSRCGRHVVMS